MYQISTSAELMFLFASIKKDYWFANFYRAISSPFHILDGCKFHVSGFHFYDHLSCGSSTLKAKFQVPIFIALCRSNCRIVKSILVWGILYLSVTSFHNYSSIFYMEEELFPLLALLPNGRVSSILRLWKVKICVNYSL